MNPAFSTARIMSSTVTLLGSKITSAVPLGKLTSAFLTPSSPSRARLTTSGHVNHVIPSMRRVACVTAPASCSAGAAEEAVGAGLSRPSRAAASMTSTDTMMIATSATGRVILSVHHQRPESIGEQDEDHFDGEHHCRRSKENQVDP